MRIGIFGSAAIADKGVMAKARELGREIARQGHVLVTGGCPGLPYEAVLGAREFNGQCIAYSPALDLDDHVLRFGFPRDGFTEWVFLPHEFPYKDDKHISLKYRNICSVASVDAGIIIGGRTGTMNEFTLLYDWGKNVGVLMGTGGITERAIPVLIADIDKTRGSRIVYETSPASLVDKITRLYTDR